MRQGPATLRRPDVSAILTVLEHVQEFRHLHRGAGSPGAAVAIDAIRHKVADMLRSEFAPGTGEPRFRKELRIHYLVGAFMAALVWWMERGAHEPPESVERMFNELSMKGALPPSPA